MKVAIITLHAINNYGSVLQALATERIFIDLGLDVETIDYVRETAQLDSAWKIMKYGGPGMVIKIKQLFLHIFSKKSDRGKVLDEFRIKYLHLTKRRYFCDNDLIGDVPQADIYCTGSDQTWNVVVQGGIPYAFFLDFAPKSKKRISFAASFGIDSIPSKYQREVESLLKKYSAISVRETSGKRIIDDMYIKNVQVLDPTIAVGRDFWLSFASKREVEGDYLFVYQLNSSNDFSKYVINFANKKDIKIVYVKSRKVVVYSNAIYYEAPTPQVLLSLFKYSKYVITDSFHATVFSILFHCNFADIFPSRFPTRLESILELTGLQSRHVEDLSNYTYHDIAIDYDRVDRIIQREREKTYEFLKKAIS